MRNNPIGAFDSGVGGLSVLRELLVTLPKEDFIYVADQKHVPYGGKSLEQVRQYSENITRFLLAKGAKCIVIPCNTASGAALNYLREMFPYTPFIGMEPAVKPAAEVTKTGKVGVLATQGTFMSERYCSLVERFGKGIEVFENPCIGLVDLIENSGIDSPKTKDLLAKVITPMMEEGVDTLVLGCTHYPFIQSVLKSIIPEQIEIINPAPAVARHTFDRLKKLKLLSENSRQFMKFYTTGDTLKFQSQIAQLIGLQTVVKGLKW